MNILPFENLILETSLSKEEVVKRIQDNTEAEQTIRFGGIFSDKSHKLFEGYATHYEFEIRRILEYRNSFLPIITGEITHNGLKTEIHIKMRMKIFVAIFMCIWLGGVGLMCVFLLYRMISEKQFEAPFLIPFGMFLFGSILSIGGFKWEVDKAKKDLISILEAKNTL